MKISKLFHWLYFIVMMLPILSIPIFAIYSHRHTIDSYQVEQEEVKSVDFNQLCGPDIDSSGSFSGINYTFQDGLLNLDGTASSTSDLLLLSYDVFTNGHIYYLKGVPIGGTAWSTYSIRFNVGGAQYTIPSLFTYNSDNNVGNLTFLVYQNTSLDNLSFYPQVIDLTQMFGAGNEPSMDQFNSWYPKQYYEYTLSRKELLYTGGVISYDDQDIGSQLIYDTYNVVNNYFNYDKVFNFYSLYDWLQLTFFNGNASLGFFIFWHLLIYWLLTSLLWLLFDVLMYVPQLVHRWLDKASLS